MCTWQVRCLEDYGEFETEDGTVVLLKKNSQVRKSTFYGEKKQRTYCFGEILIPLKKPGLNSSKSCFLGFVQYNFTLNRAFSQGVTAAHCCTKTMKWRSCWCTKPVLWELKSFVMLTLFLLEQICMAAGHVSENALDYISHTKFFGPICLKCCGWISD